MLELKCAVCATAAPEDLWAMGWIGVMADGTVVSCEDASGVPSHLALAPRVGNSIVCSRICLHLLVWRETYRPREQIPDRF